MRKPALTITDYKKLLQFSMEINVASNDFMIRVMKALRTCFGYSLTSYSVFDTPKENLRVNMNFMNSLSLERYFLEQCIEAAETDTKLYPYLLNARNSNDWNGVCYSQDMKNFQNTTFYKVFRVRQIDYAAYLLILDQPEMLLYILKPGKDGPFSEHEKLLIAEIRKIVSQAAANYVSRNFQLTARNAVGNVMSDESVGCLVLEENMHYLWYNKVFAQMLYVLYGISDADNLARNFRKDVEAETRCPFLDLQGIRRVFQNRFLIRVEQIYTPEAQSVGLQYAICTLKQTDPAEDVFAQTDADTQLTRREKEIWDLIAGGMSNEEIAEQLSISVHTVKAHVSNLLRKLKVSSRLEAALLKMNKEKTD